MSKRRWSCLVVSFLLTTTIACKPITEDDRIEPDADPSPVATVAPAQQATITAAPTSGPPPRPTAAPTSTTANDWQQMGNKATGIQLALPNGWVNLTDRLDTAAATRPLGLISLFASDSERTGRSLLAGKAITQGAFVVGLIADFDLPANAPMSGLETVLAQSETAVSPVTAPQPIAPNTVSGPVTGATVTVQGDPINLITQDGADLLTRILFFTPNTAIPTNANNAQAIVLLAAPASQWEHYRPTFNRITQTIVIHDIWSGYVVSEGSGNVQGMLQSQQPVNGVLDANVKDIWTFNSNGTNFATLTLEPKDDMLDLALAVINPRGQTIAQVDNGFAGDTEIATDISLLETGFYVVEVRDFFGESGHYQLNLVLTDDPLYSSGGNIAHGQNVRSDVPPGRQHVWRFSGTARETVSIVLTPEDEQLDVILNLYGPDGHRLEALDEGFSGDPEVIAGFELPVTGEYAIVVRTFAEDGGPYSLSLDEGGEPTANFYDAGDLSYGDVKRETFQENEAHAWFFEGRANDVVAIEALPLDAHLDLDVWLLDANIERLAVQDKYPAGQLETLQTTLPADGQYVILVREFFGEAGTYEVRLTAETTPAPDYAGMLTYGRPEMATLATSQSVIWQFEASEEDVVDIQLAPITADNDLVLQLQDPAGRTVLTVDKGLSGAAETIDGFALPSAGRWGLVVSEFFDNTAEYELTVQLSD